MGTRLERSLLKIFFRFLLLVVFSTALSAQEATGRIIGTIYDQTGAVLSGAHVVATNTATHISRAVTSDSGGAYQIAALPIGSYRIAVDHKGFSPVTTNPIKLEINQSAKIDVNMQVGSETQTVTIEGAASTVETITPTMGSTVLEQEIGNAPLNGRNALDLVLLQPGVAPADNPGNAGAASANTRFSIDGGRNDSNTFLLDGGINNDLLDNGVVYNPNPDAIEEFKVLTSNFTAEYGRSSGGIVTVVTKSGTNAFHGTAFEYNRNDAYNANRFINKALGQPRPILKRNQYGATLGGPIKKDKLFFFVAYQGQREIQITPANGSTLTPSELAGDFSASPNQASVAAFLQANPFFQPDPTKQGVNPGDPTIIDPTKFDPVAKAYIKAGLIPTSTLPLGAISFQNPVRDDRDEITGKFDFEATSKDHFTVTLGRSQNPNLGLLAGVSGSGATAQPGSPQFVSSGNAHRQFLNLAYTRILTPTMLNEFRMTAQRRDTLQAKPPKTFGTPSSFGSNITPDNPTGPSLLTFPALSVGFSPQGPSTLIDNTFSYSDTFSWTHGAHTLKFGGSFSAFQDNQVFDFFVNGNFDFVSSLDGKVPFAAGDEFANFLVGVPDSFFQAPAAPSNIRTKATYIFGQDEWHVARNLVLTLGLRYEGSTPKLDTKGRTFSIVPGLQSTVFPNAPVGVLFPGDKGAPTGANYPRKTDFAPRFGFAWQPFHNQKTSIRGGIGMFYDVLKAEDNFQFNGQFPFASTAFIGYSDPSGTAAPFGFVTDPFGSTGSTNPFPSKPVDHNVNFANTVGTFGGGGVFFVDPHLRTPYTYQYNLSIEHQLAGKLVAEAAYVGSSSHGLTGLKDINPFDPAALSRGIKIRILNETPGNVDGSLGFLPQFMNVANANYNALQVSLRQHPTSVPILGSVYYTFGYTWAHSIDDASGFRNNNSQVPFFLPHIFRGSSDYDLRHVLTFSGGWDLPFNRGPKALVKGWSLYPNITWRTGFPLTITAGLPELNGTPGPSGEGDGNLVNANLVGPVRYLDPHHGLLFFDPKSFSSAVASGYGTAARNLLRGPGRTNMDLSLTKTTPIYGDRVNLKFSVDAFNIFNHTEFSRVGTNAAAQNLGQVTDTYAPRILQLGAHINF
ncbi:MAG TPA: carboxypeptidase regulatory-like domain-containing protein [Terriglobales bacterium]|nr:carboxypeptidase regulatory-like domain-containing protein [Terriglobales bacterium]